MNKLCYYLVVGFFCGAAAAAAEDQFCVGLFLKINKIKLDNFLCSIRYKDQHAGLGSRVSPVQKMFIQ
jgi:hypothetical protein